uniref:Uncharacterized protein n=1 Tax=Tanacetum cinerariifolium TaxID=118510 RepID=A0A699TP40_TANCI|nr:hypothetical protein [Tanacetum cinerariifolium]
MLLQKGVSDVMRGKIVNPDVPRYYYYKKKLSGDAKFEKCVPKFCMDDEDAKGTTQIDNGLDVIFFIGVMIVDDIFRGPFIS